MFQGTKKTPAGLECVILLMVLGGGLEPPRLAAYAPQTYVSAISPPEHRLKRDETSTTKFETRKRLFPKSVFFPFSEANFPKKAAAGGRGKPLDRREMQFLEKTACVSEKIGQITHLISAAR